MGSLFDLTHLIYIFVSLSITFLLLYIAKKYFSKSFLNEWFLKFFALSTFFLHISPLWINFLNNGSSLVADNMIFPIYFCNLSMYMLMIVAFWGNKKSKAFKNVALFTGYAGIFGSLISLFYPDYYLGASSIFEWGVFKSMLSHSTMLVGALWIFLGKYVDIRLNHTYKYFIGLLGYGIIGLVVNNLFEANNLVNPNAMYLTKPPLEEFAFLNWFTISFLMVLFIGVFTYIYEIKFLKEEERTKFNFKSLKVKQGG